MPVFPLSSQLTLDWPAPPRTTSSRATLCGFLYHHEESRGKRAKLCFIAQDHSSTEGNSLSREQTERQTHRISNFEIPTLPEPGIGQPVLARGSEGQANVLRAVPDCELHLGPNTLETQWESKPSSSQRQMCFFCFTLFSWCFQRVGRPSLHLYEKKSPLHTHWHLSLT